MTRERRWFGSRADVGGLDHERAREVAIGQRRIVLVDGSTRVVLLNGTQ